MSAHSVIDPLKRLMVLDQAAVDSVAVLVAATMEILEVVSVLVVDQVVLVVVEILVVSKAEALVADLVEDPAAVDPLCLSVVCHTEKV